MMSSPRQIYQYLVAGISFQAVLWAVISLLRDLFSLSGSSFSTDIIAQLSVIIIGLPIFLVHWIWAQRLAIGNEEERGSPVRQFFLYGQIAGLLGPIIDSAFAVLSALILSGTGGSMRWHRVSLTTGQEILFFGLALVALVPSWLYFRNHAREDAKSTTLEGTSSIIRQIFIYAYAGVGLGMVYYASIDLLSVLFHLPSAIGNPSSSGIGRGILLIAARLSLGIPIWVYFWNRAQSRYQSDEIDERQSAVRGWYLYLLVFASLLSAVTSLTLMLEGFLRRLLDVSSISQSNDDLILAISVVLCSGVVWYYHSRIIRRDAELETETSRRETLRRIYLYLMAGIGFAVVLAGVVGLLTTLLTALEGGHFAPYLRGQLALGISLLTAGVPIWLYFWNAAQTRAAEEGRGGMDERESLPRRIYLYAFMFISTIVLLITAISLVMRFLGMLLGEPVPLGAELGRLLAYAIIAAIVLAYQVYVLRVDRSLGVPEKVVEAVDNKVIIIHRGNQEFVDLLIKRIEDRRVPAEVEAIQVSSSLSQPNVLEEVKNKLQSAQVILLDWETLLNESLSAHLAQLLDEIEARKILMPLGREGWDWAGVERWNRDRLVNQVIYATRKALRGQEVGIQKTMGCGTIIGILVLVTIGLFLLLSVLVRYIPY